MLTVARVVSMPTHLSFAICPEQADWVPEKARGREEERKVVPEETVMG